MAVDVQKWLTDNMNNLSLSDDDRAAAQRLLSGPLGQRLGSSIARQEDVSNLQSALDRQRNEAHTRQTELENWNLTWQERYQKDMLDLNAIDKLEAAGYDVSGYQQSARGGVTNTSTGQTFSAAEVRNMLSEQEQRFAQMQDANRVGMVDYATFVADFAGEYRDAYGKPFPAAAFRKFAYDNRTQYPTLQSAAEAFTAEDRKTKLEADRKQWELDKEKEIELRVMSNMTLPEAAGAGADGAPFHAVKDNAKPDPNAPSPSQNRQEFAKKFSGKDFNITI